ncbi:MAG: hypothetical protein HC805_00500 [Alkalinema sp. RL_2_19]|nr:hypothetical protein [Alkalinema sp. RL_2_19]
MAISQSGNVMASARALHIQEAFSFYRQFILEYSQNKAAIYERYGFTLQGSVGSKDWEVFAAILLGDRAKPGDGADLFHHEVKSAIVGNSFEYQYHRNHGREKLEADKEVDHVFISRDQTYHNIEVWLVERQHLAPIFNAWQPELQANYAESRRQRFRKSISYGFVKKYGRKILTIVNGQLASPSESDGPAD